ncbi:MAG TPA: hypothetical protein VGL41_09130, partial [Roseiarcus sp.]
GQARAPPPTKVSTCSMNPMLHAFAVVAACDEGHVALQQRHSDGEPKRGRTIGARSNSYSGARR